MQITQILVSKTIQQDDYEPLRVELTATVGNTEAVGEVFDNLMGQIEELLGITRAADLEPPKDAAKKSDDPVARTLRDLVSAKQLGMIRAIAREKGVDANEECQSLLGCNTDELKRSAASILIQHLQKK
jgi:hypothetical protein